MKVKKTYLFGFRKKYWNILMKLKELLEKHPKVTLATKEDNNEILTFFSTLPMEGTKTAISYEREPNFFKFLSFCGPLSFIFLIRLKKNGEILGVGTLVLRPGLIKGEKKWVGYLGDLRVKPNPRASVIWRKFYGDLLSNSDLIEEFGGCEFFYTSILKENLKAMNALVHNKKNPFQYFHLMEYKMVNILIKYPELRLLPNFQKIELDVHFSRACLGDKEEIIKFLRCQNKKRAFGFCFEEHYDELNFRLDKWDNIVLENFILAKDKKGQIKGLTLLWSPSPSKKIKIEKLPPSLKFYFLVQGLLKKSPQEGEELEVLYLNFLEIDQSLKEVDKKLIFSSMIDYVYRLPQSKSFHAISYCSFEKTLFDNLEGYVMHSTALSLYLVQRRKKIGEDEVTPDLGLLPPGFEMSLV